MSDSSKSKQNSSTTAAGFPSPAADYVEKKLDLNELLVSNKEATFFLRVSGDSMSGASINNGDLIVVDRSLPVEHKKIIVCVVDGEILIKRLLRDGKRISLVAENPDHPAIEVTEDLDFQVWGVVTSVIHQVS